MKEYAPYIIAFIVQTIGFCVWIVRSNNNFDKKIAVMENQITELKKENDEAKKEVKEISTKLSIVSELLAVCKNHLDLVSIKFMKTRSA